MLKHILLIAAVSSCSAVYAADPAPSQTSSARTEGPAVNTSPGVPTSSQATKSRSTDAAPAQSANQNSNNATPRRSDRLNLDTTVVTGNRELPKVLYIVPWKKADIGDLPAQPFNTLLDEALAPVDRDVFRREVTYYGAVSSSANAGNPASATPAPGTEK
jgi:hypothetical protein